MKTRSFVAAIAALSLPILAVTAGDAAATKIVEIQGKYSKIKLDGICAANGGSSYGTAGGSYGCTKGSNTVECQARHDERSRRRRTDPAVAIAAAQGEACGRLCRALRRLRQSSL